MPGGRSRRLSERRDRTRPCALTALGRDPADGGHRRRGSARVPRRARVLGLDQGLPRQRRPRLHPGRPRAPGCGRPKPRLGAPARDRRRRPHRRRAAERAWGDRARPGSAPGRLDRRSADLGRGVARGEPLRGVGDAACRGVPGSGARAIGQPRERNPSAPARGRRTVGQDRGGTARRRGRRADRGRAAGRRSRRDVRAPLPRVRAHNPRAAGGCRDDRGSRHPRDDEALRDLAPHRAGPPEVRLRKGRRSQPARGPRAL